MNVSVHRHYHVNTVALTASVTVVYTMWEEHAVQVLWIQEGVWDWLE